MSSSNCCFLTCIQVSQETGQVVWYSHFFQDFPQFIVIHTVKGFGIVNEAEIDAFLELSCFFHDPADVGKLITGSSAFSKTSLNIWKFMVHVLLKLRGATRHPKSGRWPRGATPRSRSGEVDKRSNPTSKEWWLHRHRKAERRYSTFKFRKCGHEEIPLVQGKEQQLRFAGAAVKRYPTPKVRETKVRR